MGMTIGNYRAFVRPMMKSARLDDALVLSANNVLGLKTQDSPPAWAHWVLSLSETWQINDSFLVKLARARAKGNALEAREKESAQRSCMVGFLAGLRNEYGAAISEACLAHCAVNPERALTARTVIAVLKKADEEKDHYANTNECSLRRFLTDASPATAGAQTLAGVFDEILALDDGRESLAASVGVHAAKFITDYIENRCRALPAYGQSIMNESVFVEAAQDALALYREVANVPGITRAALGTIFLNASREGSLSETRSALGRAALISAMERKLDWNNPGSFLAIKAAELESAAPEKMRVSSVVLEEISAGMSSAWRTEIDVHLSDLGQGLTLATVAAVFENALEFSIANAIAAHQEALKKIRTHRHYSKDQRATLFELAAKRRIDLALLAVYEAMYEKKMQAHAATLASAVSERGFLKCIVELGAIQVYFREAEETLIERGVALRACASLPKGEALMAELFGLALISLEWAEAERLLTCLTGTNGHHLVQGLALSAEGRALLAIYNGLILEAGRHAGAGAQMQARVARMRAETLSENEIPCDLKEALRACGSLSRYT